MEDPSVYIALVNYSNIRQENRTRPQTKAAVFLYQEFHNLKSDIQIRMLI